MRQIKNELETRLDHTVEEFDQIMQTRLKYLPGAHWPEKVLVENAKNSDDISYLQQEWEATESDIVTYLERAIAAGKHNEFFALSQALQLPLETVRRSAMRFYKQTNQAAIDDIISSIDTLLPAPVTI